MGYGVFDSRLLSAVPGVSGWNGCKHRGRLELNRSLIKVPVVGPDDGGVNRIGGDDPWATTQYLTRFWLSQFRKSGDVGIPDFFDTCAGVAAEGVSS